MSVEPVVVRYLRKGKCNLPKKIFSNLKTLSQPYPASAPPKNLSHSHHHHRSNHITLKPPSYHHQLPDRVNLTRNKHNRTVEPPPTHRLKPTRQCQLRTAKSPLPSIESHQPNRSPPSSLSIESLSILLILSNET